MMMAGDSIKAMTATMCPPNAIFCDSRKEAAATNVTALTEPYAAATAPANPIGSGITTPSVDPRGTNVPKDNTILYVGLAGAGVLLITGFVYMASKGK